MTFIYSIKCSSPYFFTKAGNLRVRAHVFFKLLIFFEKKRRHMLVSNYQNYFEKKDGSM